MSNKISINEMNNILEKLAKVTSSSQQEEWKEWEEWTLDEKISLLELYKLFCIKEANIFRMIYNHQGCDSYEDIFRDFNMVDVNDKIIGVQLAIDSIIEQRDYD